MFGLADNLALSTVRFLPKLGGAAGGIRFAMVFLTLRVFLSFLAGWLCLAKTCAIPRIAGAEPSANALFKYANRRRHDLGLVSPVNRSIGSMPGWSLAQYPSRRQSPETRFDGVFCGLTFGVFMARTYTSLRT